jgi:predicted transglutaminase-like cysteine proteinase
MTHRPEAKTPSQFCGFAVGLAVVVALSGCATEPRSGVVDSTNVVSAAPKLAAFSFHGEPIAEASDFGPWAALSAQTEADDALMQSCLADKRNCASADIVRFRKMIDLARALPPRDQLNLVHHYFNTIEWTTDARETWSSVYHTALTKRGDCEDIALAKYQTLRMLGWSAQDLRMVVGWDGEEKDWHALLAVRLNDDVLILDSIKGLQSPALLGSVRLVYSISESGVWDHAPQFVPRDLGGQQRMVSKRAARLAALEQPPTKGDIQ